jgi:prophage antirepressor-like protein
MTSQGSHTTAPALKTFTFVPGLDLCAIDREGCPWFIARDVLTALDISVAGSNLDHLDGGDKVRLNLGLRGKSPWFIASDACKAARHVSDDNKANVAVGLRAGAVPC